MAPRVSIIIPVFEHQQELEACLVSLTKQTFQDFEVIVVDDGTRPPIKLSCVMCHVSVKLIRQENAGAPVARNRGLKEAGGEYLLFSDADIVWQPQALAKMVHVLETQPNISYVYAAFNWGRKLFKALPFDLAKLKQMNYVHASALIRRADFPATGWDEKIKKFQDWDLWLTMAKTGHTGQAITEVLMDIKPGGHYSSWLPAFVYKIPGARFFNKNVRKYEDAKKIIYQKHHL